MGTEVLERRFAAIGARLNVVGPPAGAPRIDVRLGTRVASSSTSASPAAAAWSSWRSWTSSRADRHLLLLVRDGDEKSKFLCGYDERHWFVAAVPEAARGVTRCRGGEGGAAAAGCPDGGRAGRGRRIPSAVATPLTSARASGSSSRRPTLDPPAAFVLRNEPLSRGRGTAHMIELAYRRGGQVVWVNNASSERHQRRALSPADGQAAA